MSFGADRCENNSTHLAICAGAEQNGICHVQRELFALSQMLGEQGCVAICHMEGSPASYTAHVQHSLAAFRGDVLIEKFSGPILGAAPDFSFRFQLCQVPIDGAQADFFVLQLISELFGRHKLIWMFVQGGEQRLLLFGIVV